MEILTGKIFPNTRNKRKYYAVFPYLVAKYFQHLKSNILSFSNDE